ncbi:MAG TPA: hypothetical protein PKD24_06600 [Pyrinomonadaceae bacterium]|nr:hypothetical protein [Pyrinomonadaceae bacterium]HMP65173.1 hypothetical protein [Pyrinomonadaceae bacterium]
MKRWLQSIFIGSDGKISGIVALAIVALIALGCTCTRSLDLGDVAENTSTSNDSPTSENTPANDRRSGPTRRADASKGEMPDDDELQSMIKATLLEFNDAIQSEDFTEFYSNICEPWKKQTSPEKLKASFQKFIDSNITIASIDPLTAEFSPQPSVGRELGYRTLKINGRYSTSPMLTKFELNYIPEGKEWKLSKIVVDTTQRN